MRMIITIRGTLLKIDRYVLYLYDRDGMYGSHSFAIHRKAKIDASADYDVMENEYACTSTSISQVS